MGRHCGRKLERAFHRFDCCLEALEDARLLYDHGRYKNCRNRAYYPIFHEIPCAGRVICRRIYVTLKQLSKPEKSGHILLQKGGFINRDIESSRISTRRDLIHVFIAKHPDIMPISTKNGRKGLIL